MADIFSEVSTFLTNSSIYFISSMVCGFIILVVLVRKSLTESTQHNATSRCTSPSCARCRGEEEIREKLLRRLREHATVNCGVRAQDLPTHLSENYSRLLSTIDSYDRKTEVLSSIYSESGHGDVSTRYLAHVWMMPGLQRTPLWRAKDHTALESLFSNFEQQGNFEKVLQEYKIVSEVDDAWKQNELPTGSWKTCFLMNQGSFIQENCEKYPQTLHFLKATGYLMEGIVFGNALFSVLKPGSRIEPHTSPCNFRLRCHLALNASSGFHLQVGKLTVNWKTGRLLVFDDSFVHSVWHDASYRESNSSPVAEESVKDRVVLIFDIWHPDISHSEQQALKYMFN